MAIFPVEHPYSSFCRLLIVFCLNITDFLIQGAFQCFIIANKTHLNWFSFCVILILASNQFRV